MPWSIALDLVVAVLLIVTIAYAMVLNRRIGSLRKDKKELETLAASFHQATVRAEDSIGRLRNTADALQQRIDKAQSLSDDLSFLIDRGGLAADRLEELVRAARKEGEGEVRRPVAPAATDAGAPATAGDEPEAAADEAKSEAERELLKALQAAR